MLTDLDLPKVLGSTVYTGDGEKIGTVGQLFSDAQTGRPEWATVQTGLFGSSESFVPLEAASLESGELRVPYSKDRVTDAPHVEAEAGQLDEAGERALFEYYGLPYDAPSGSQVEAAPVAEAGADTPVGTSGTQGADPDRVEEPLTQADTDEDSARTAQLRLRRYVATQIG